MQMKQIILLVKLTSELWNGRGIHIERTDYAEQNRSDRVTEGQAMIHTHACRIYMFYVILCHMTYIYCRTHQFQIFFSV